MTTADLSTFIKNQAIKLGFDACGIAKSGQISCSDKKRFQTWLETSYHAEMQYMERNQGKRQDPGLLVEGCQSVVVVALNYEPAEMQDKGAPAIARFAYGKDYHSVIRTKLRILLERINETGITVHGRAFADSAPIAERCWAQKAGLGWIGKNHCLILPGKGSFFLLGELLIDIGLDYDTPMPSRCGKCRRCLDACPTNALNETRGLNANRCLSYLTIEKHGNFNREESAFLSSNNCLFGCDLCQTACPWNRFASANNCPELQPEKRFLTMKRENFENMTKEEFNKWFKGTCLERTGYEGIIRNIRAQKNGHL